MTRCPNTCDKSDPEGKAHGPCELKPGHDGLCVAFGQTFDAAPARDTSGDVGPADHLDGLVAYATPAPHDAPLDFDAAARAAQPERHPMDALKAMRESLTAQARAYADAAVKRAKREEREKVLQEVANVWHSPGDEGGLEFTTWLMNKRKEARDDPR